MPRKEATHEATEPTQSMVKKDTASVALYGGFEQDAGDGFGNADKDSYAIPFLIVLQSNSPQCTEGEPQYRDDARPGMFFNTATEDLYDGKKGVEVVPVHFQRRFVEWVPRDMGGGYRGDHAPEDVDLSAMRRDDSGKFILENGNTLIDTRYHFCLIISGQTIQNAVIALSSTQIKKSRMWMTKMNSIKLDGQRGKFTPPSYSHVYRLTSTLESNDRGSWRGVEAKLERVLNDTEQAVYETAKEFKAMIVSGAARIEEPGADDEDTPF